MSTVPLGASSSSTTVGADRALAAQIAAPATWDDSSGPGISDSTTRHVAHLRTLSENRATQSSLAAEDIASSTSPTHAERSSALHLQRITSDPALLATNTGAVAKRYSFIAQATDSLQHQQQRYDDTCTPGNAAALDVARIALTRGLAALHGVLPLSVLFPYGDQHGTPYFTRDDLLVDDPTAPHERWQRTRATRRTVPSPMRVLFAIIASTIFIAQLSASATFHTELPSTATPHSPAATVSTGPAVLPDGSGISIQADETRAGVADLSVTAKTSGPIRSGTLATNARTRGTGPSPSKRGSEHAMRDTLHQHRIHSAALLRKLMATTTTSQCNLRTT